MHDNIVKRVAFADPLERYPGDHRSGQAAWVGLCQKG